MRQGKAIYKDTPDLWEKRQIPIKLGAGLLAGSIAAACTNGLEAVTVIKQTAPETNLINLVKKEGISLVTKGLGARVAYNGAQSALFFALVGIIEKEFNVKLDDD